MPEIMDTTSTYKFGYTTNYFQRSMYNISFFSSTSIFHAFLQNKNKSEFQPRKVMPLSNLIISNSIETST